MSNTVGSPYETYLRTRPPKPGKKGTGTKRSVSAGKTRKDQPSHHDGRQEKETRPSYHISAWDTEEAAVTTRTEASGIDGYMSSDSRDVGRDFAGAAPSKSSRDRAGESRESDLLKELDDLGKFTAYTDGGQTAFLSGALSGVKSPTKSPIRPGQSGKSRAAFADSNERAAALAREAEEFAHLLSTRARREGENDASTMSRGSDINPLDNGQVPTMPTLKEAWAEGGLQSQFARNLEKEKDSSMSNTSLKDLEKLTKFSYFDDMGKRTELMEKVYRSNSPPNKGGGEGRSRPVEGSQPPKRLNTAERRAAYDALFEDPIPNSKGKRDSSSSSHRPDFNTSMSSYPTQSSPYSSFPSQNLYTSSTNASSKRGAAPTSSYMGGYAPQSKFGQAVMEKAEAEAPAKVERNVLSQTNENPREFTLGRKVATRIGGDSPPSRRTSPQRREQELEMERELERIREKERLRAIKRRHAEGANGKKKGKAAAAKKGKGGKNSAYSTRPNSRPKARPSGPPSPGFGIRPRADSPNESRYTTAVRSHMDALKRFEGLRHELLAAEVERRTEEENIRNKASAWIKQLANGEGHPPYYY